MIAMQTTVQDGNQTLSDMVAELKSQGTVAGCATLAELKADGVGVELFVREEDIDRDSRMRQLAGAALSRGLTYSQLLAQLHEDLVVRLRIRLMADDSVASEPSDFPLIEEILGRESA